MFEKIERAKTLAKKNKIFIDYIHERKEIKKYFKEKISLGDIKATSKRVIDVLKEYHESCGAKRETLENIERLKNKNTYVVITGQQPVLVAGPIYIVYKIIDTIKYAKELSKKLNKEVVPVFWNASDDDDWEEVNHVYLINKDNTLKKLEITPKKDIKNIPYGRINLNDLYVEKFIESLEANLADTKFKEEISAIKDSSAAAYCYSQWFSILILRLFSKHGLVVIDPKEKEIKKLLKPLFEEEIKNPTFSTNLLNKAGERLKEDGYIPKIHKLSHLCNFFISRRDKRCPVAYHYDYFLVGEEKYSQKDLLAYLEDRPENFYVNVVLRTLAQSLLLPVIACICGPGEVSYFAQLKDIYEAFNLKMPYLIPRASITLIEERVGKILNKYNLKPIELRDDKSALVNKIIKERHRLEKIDKLKNKTIDSLESIKEPILNIDQNLLSAFKKLSYQISISFAEFEKSVIKHQKKDSEVILKQITYLKDNLFPNNYLQEKGLNVFYFLNKYGLDFVNYLMERMPLDFKYHHYIEITPTLNKIS